MNEKERNYYDDGALSQTDLKSILKGPTYYTDLLDQKKKGGLFYTDETLFYKEREGVLIGSAVDYYFSYGKEEFDKLFTVLDEDKKPGEKPLAIAHEMLEMVSVTLESAGPAAVINMETFKDDFVEIARGLNYQGRTKDPVKYWDKLVSDIDSYWQALVMSYGKKLLSQNQMNSVNNAIMSLTTNPVTKDYFQDYTNNSVLDVGRQVSIKWEDATGTKLKSLLDLIVINHEKKQIQPVDYKVMYGDTIYFPYRADDLRYDIQGAFYTDAVHYWKNNIVQGLATYEVLPFQFVVESYTDPGIPLIYTLSRETEGRGRIGDADRYKDKGYIQAIKLYKYYDENNQWLVRKEIIDNNYRVTF